MAEKHGEAAYGGYDCEFVDKVSDRLNCNICTKSLRDPHLVVCCGQHYCESCLNKWFSRQDKESCPHCRAEGEAFTHVIDKSVRSEIIQLKIRCSNHGEGCQWTGELGALMTHLESDKGCGFVMVECPIKCRTLMKRKDVHKHLTQFCYLRPYQCQFCGLEDTYKAITGDGEAIDIALYNAYDDYGGHQATCPEVLLTCPNMCGSNKIKRKDMEIHRTLCPQEPVECPFAEVGCRVDVRRHQLEDHMTTSLQQHVMLLMIDRKQLKEELSEVKAQLSKAETERDQTKQKLCETEADHSETKCKLRKAETEIDETKLKFYETATRLTFCEAFGNPLNKLKNKGSCTKVIMYKFSEYRRIGKVWHSPPFYYREGYKMRLAVYANGVGKGAGTHVSVALLHLAGEYDNKLKWPMKSCNTIGHWEYLPFEARVWLLVCQPLQRLQVNECKEISYRHRFCGLNSEALRLVNDCLSFSIQYDSSDCFLKVSLE